MASDEGSTKLKFLNVKQVDYRVVCTCRHPWVPLSEVYVIHWEEVVFEHVDNLELRKLLIVQLYCLVKLDRTNNMSRRNQRHVSSPTWLKPDAVNCLFLLKQCYLVFF